jgi:predicted enzyme related to lactoylglutathione lyase
VEVLSSRVLYRARDFDGLRRFYEEVLGLRIYREYGAAGTVTGVVYFLGGGFLELTRGGGTSSPLTLWLQVPDLAAESDRLRAAGVPIARDVERMPWGLLELWAHDPEGNELRLVEVPPEHPLRRRLG